MTSSMEDYTVTSTTTAELSSSSMHRRTKMMQAKYAGTGKLQQRSKTRMRARDSWACIDALDLLGDLSDDESTDDETDTSSSPQTEVESKEDEETSRERQRKGQSQVNNTLAGATIVREKKTSILKRRQAAMKKGNFMRRAHSPSRPLTNQERRMIAMRQGRRHALS